jgi:hypothetical protein
MKLKNRRGRFSKKIRKLKAPEQNSKMLTYKFIIFFGEQDIILVQGKNSKFRQDNALGNLCVVAKIFFFFEDKNKYVEQC